MKRIITTCLLMPALLHAQGIKTNRTDSLVAVYQSAAYAKMRDSDKVLFLDKLSFAYATSDPSNGLKMATEMLKISKQLNWENYIGNALQNHGLNYMFLSDYKTALKFLNQAADQYLRIKSKSNLGTAYTNIGTTYFRLANYPRSLEYTYKALKIKEEVGDSADVALCYSNLGNTYLDQSEYEKAQKYYGMAKELFKLAGDSSSYAATTGNLANIYISTQNYVKGLQYSLEALRMHNETGNKMAAAKMDGNIGAIYLMQGKYKKACEYFNESLRISEEMGDKDGMVTVLSNLGVTNLYMSIDSASLRTQAGGRSFLVQKAIEYLKRAANISTEIGNMRMQYNNLVNLTEAYEQAGNYKEALATFRKFEAVKDTLFNKENNKKQLETRMQYEYNKKADASQALLDKQLAVEKEITRSKLKVGGIAASSLLTIILISFYFYRRKEKDKFTQEITEVKRQALNAQMSDHFIGNTIDSINNFIHDNDKEKASQYLALFSRLIRRVLVNSSARLIPLNEDLSILKDYINLEALRFTNDGLQHEIVVADDIDAQHALIPPMIFQVLTENAIKHGFRKTEGGKLHIEVKKKGNFLDCTVTDNGSGRKTTAHKIHADGSRNSMGGSLAEKLVKSSSIQGKNTSYSIRDLYDESGNPVGTSANFVLPYILED
jgi:tetratricopeptide (TPR) repeat protein